jgi:predicted PurR-regulated permease PerM
MIKSLSKSTRYLVLVLVLISLVALTVAASDLIAPLAISALLAWLLNPAVTLFDNRTKLKRQWAVLIVYLFSLAIIITLGILLAIFAPSQIYNAAKDFQNLSVVVVQQIEEHSARTFTLLGYQVNPAEIVSNITVDTSQFMRPDIILEWLRAASTNLTWILVIILTTFYLLQDWPRLRDWLIRLAPDHYQSDFQRVYKEVKDVWQRYLRGQLRLSLIIGALTTLLLTSVGLPGAVVFGILAAIFDVILTVGPLIVMAAAAAVALLAGSSFLPLSNAWFTLLVLAVFALIQIFENVWLRPRVMGQSLNMHPGVIFVGIVGALSMAGIFAALIVVPVLGSTAVIGHYIHAKIMDIPPWPDVQITPAIPPESGEEASLNRDKVP